MKALHRYLCRAFLLLLLLLVVVMVPAGSITTLASGLGREYCREDFPPAPGFVFGSGTSAYQVEGAAAEDGRSPSVWDTAAHAGRMADRTTGDIACDGYHKYKDDVKLMKETGLEAYRFSISWSRLLPSMKMKLGLQSLPHCRLILPSEKHYLSQREEETSTRRV